MFSKFFAQCIVSSTDKVRGITVSKTLDEIDGSRTFKEKICIVKITYCLNTSARVEKNGVKTFENIQPAFTFVELTRAIEWLNRKIREIVIMNIYDYPHFIDFTNKTIFNGSEYFMEFSQKDLIFL